MVEICPNPRGYGSLKATGRVETQEGQRERERGRARRKRGEISEEQRGGSEDERPEAQLAAL